MVNFLVMLKSGQEIHFSNCLESEYMLIEDRLGSTGFVKFFDNTGFTILNLESIEAVLIYNDSEVNKIGF